MPYLGVIEREIGMELALKFKKDKWIDVNDRLPIYCVGFCIV